jgi:hypothetical protein
MTYGAPGAAEMYGDFVLSHLIDVETDGDLLEVIGDPREDPSEQCPRLALTLVSLFAVCDAGVEQFAPAPPCAQDVDTVVGGDTVEPGHGRRVGEDGLGGAHRFHKDLVDDVACVVGVAEDRIRAPLDERRITPVQVLELGDGEAHGPIDHKTSPSVQCGRVGR